MSLAANLSQRIRWLRRSSSLRLTLLLSVIFAFGMATTIFVALGFGQDALLRRLDASLQTAATAVGNGDATALPRRTIVMQLSNGARLPQPFLRAAERGGGTVRLDDDFAGSDDWRTLTAQDTDGSPVLIALPLDETENALELLRGILWATASFVILLTLGLGLFTGLIAQRRMDRITSTLTLLAQGDMTARTGTTRSRDDLDDIARQLDITASELERLVTQTRHLSASLAHDLRTPLARLRARIEMLPEGDARGAALEEASRLAGIFDTIMRVAKIEATHGNEGFDTVDLGTLIAETAEIFGPVIEDAGKDLHLETTAPGQVQADRQMVIQALANLIQNALVHGGDDITLFVHRNRIGVSDNGPGVPPDAFSEILKPMVRLDSARNSDGTGLGLALVRAVADRHGAALDLSTADPQGLRVTLKFADL